MRFKRKDCRRCLVWIRAILIIMLILCLICGYNINSIRHQEISNIIHSSNMERLFLPEKAIRKLNISEMKNIILDHNKKQIIINREVYGPVKQDCVVIVIFVRESTMNLKFMIMSLSQVKGIQETLIIFSHLQYDEQVNDLIKEIDFCRVLQIFYTYSLQLYPTEFPGLTPGDCSPHERLNIAESMNCTGARNPDMHGKFRDPKLAEKKHYWWWTTNQVFENLKTMENHEGIYIFIDNDYMFMEDFIYMTLFMHKIASTIPGCLFVTPTAAESSSTDHAKVEVMSYDPLLNSGVLAFDRSAWNSIVSHYDLFCDLDDYSWAQSLSYLSLNRIDGDRYRVMSSTFPRAYRSNACVGFGSFVDCDVQTAVHQIYNLQEQVRSHLFPTYLEVFVEIEFEDRYTSFDYVDVNGRWSDPRDKDFCRNLTVYKIKKEILRMAHQFDSAV